MSCFGIQAATSSPATCRFCGAETFSPAKPVVPTKLQASKGTQINQPSDLPTVRLISKTSPRDAGRQSPDKRDQPIRRPLRICGVALELPPQKALLDDDSGRDQRDRNDRQQSRSIRPEPQARPHEKRNETAVYWMTQSRVDSAVDHAMGAVLLILHHRRRECILVHRTRDQPPSGSAKEEPGSRNRRPRFAHQLEPEYVQRNKDHQAGERREKQAH